MVIIGNNVHSIYSFLLENVKLFYTLRDFFNIETLANSNLFKCLRAIKCSECRVETLEIFFIFVSGYRCLKHDILPHAFHSHIRPTSNPPFIFWSIAQIKVLSSHLCNTRYKKISYISRTINMLQSLIMYSRSITTTTTTTTTKKKKYTLFFLI